jgi:RNA recognition motif-containing protein
MVPVVAVVGCEDTTMVLVAIFSLAWFVIGVIAGRAYARPGSGKKERGPRRSDASGKVELYVGNLSYDVDDKELGKAFQEFGKVASARIITNRFNGKSKGYGFVEMAVRDQAMDAIRSMNGKEIKGRRLVVNEAKTQAAEND